MIKVAEDVTFCVSFRLGLGTAATAQKRQGNVELNLGCCAACLLACLLARRVAEEWGMYRHSRMPRPCYPRCSAYLRRMEGTCPEGGFDKIVES